MNTIIRWLNTNTPGHLASLITQKKLFIHVEYDALSIRYHYLSIIGMLSTPSDTG